MELRIAGIIMFLPAALVERQRQQLKSSEYRGSHVMASKVRIFIKVGFVRMWVEYLYKSGYYGS
jgi:hypothetical protein